MITAEQLQQDFHYLFPDEVPCLKRLARSLPINPVVVNIGAGSGTSGLAFMESRPDLQLITIDIEDKDSPFGSLYSEDVVLKRAKLIPSSRYTPIKGDSKDIARKHLADLADWVADSLVYSDMSDSRNDMVFVDGDHSYEGASGDILGWLPLIKPGGIMAVHDFLKKDVYAKPVPITAPHPKPWPGVDQAVKEHLMTKYQIIEWVDTLIAFRID